MFLHAIRGRDKSRSHKFILGHFELSKPSHSWSLAPSDLRVVARKNLYRKTSAVLGFTAGWLALLALPYVYSLIVPLMYFSAVLMMVGGVLVWIRNTKPGVALIVVGSFLGGFFALPSLLWRLLATALGNGAYDLPLLPLGTLLPIASLILGVLSLEPPKAKLPQAQEA